MVCVEKPFFSFYILHFLCGQPALVQEAQAGGMAGVLAAPMATLNAEKTLLTFFAPQPGQAAGTSLLFLSRCSKRFLHCVHSYS